MNRINSGNSNRLNNNYYYNNQTFSHNHHPQLPMSRSVNPYYYYYLNNYNNFPLGMSARLNQPSDDMRKGIAGNNNASNCETGQGPPGPGGNLKRHSVQVINL